jgi:hypothetical protein
MINTFNIPLHSNIGRRPISHSAFRISPTHHPKSKIKTPHDLLRTLRTGCEILNESTIPIRNADVSPIRWLYEPEAPIGINPTLVTRYSQQRLRRQSTIKHPPSATAHSSFTIRDQSSSHA